MVAHRSPKGKTVRRERVNALTGVTAPDLNAGSDQPAIR